MATQTTHFDMVKQQSAERVSVGLLNDNFDIIDRVMYDNQEKSEQLADEYNAGATYNVGDYVRRENYIYKCNTASTTGTWDSTKWDRVLITDELGGGGGSSTLAGLNDVNISSPSTGQALIYNSTTQKWVNGAGGGGSSTFAGLNDVDVAGVADKDIARYNSTTQKWEKSSDLTDLELAVSQISASTLGITNGHTILDSNGTAMAQEDDLQFASGYVEDDSGNGKTVYIEMIRISQANYNTLKANGQLKTGAKYFIYDAQPVAVNASNLPYSSTQSTKQAIDSKVGAWKFAGYIDMDNLPSTEFDWTATEAGTDLYNANEILFLFDASITGGRSQRQSTVNPAETFQHYVGIDIMFTQYRLYALGRVTDTNKIHFYATTNGGLSSVLLKIFWR